MGLQLSTKLRNKEAVGLIVVRPQLQLTLPGARALRRRQAVDKWRWKPIVEPFRKKFGMLLQKPSNILSVLRRIDTAGTVDERPPWADERSDARQDLALQRDELAQIVRRARPAKIGPTAEYSGPRARGVDKNGIAGLKPPR